MRDLFFENNEDRNEALIELADTKNKEAKENRLIRENCILECDSPSYPPETDEYKQCGCKSCLAEYKRRQK